VLGVRLAAALLSIGLLAPACARNPVTGRPELVLTSARREVELGGELARDVESSLGLVREPEALDAYVAALGARLAERSPRRDVEHHFAVVDMQEPNAFALPGGWIYVSRGLLAIANTEDELASVLAHEIAHVAARHAVQRETRALPIGILSALGALAGGLVGGEQLARAIGALPQVAGGLLLASYSREQEREADEIGQALMAQAGYDPAAMAAFFATLDAEVALDAQERGQRPRGPSFFDTHPGTPERRRAAETRAATLARGAPAPLAGTRAEFLARLDGLRVAQNPAEGVFHHELFLHPDLDFALHFPAGWQTQNARDAVAAVAPRGEAALVLRLQGRGDDPRAAAADFARQHQLVLSDLQRVPLDGIDAVRALAGVPTRDGAFVADLSFVAHGGMIFRVAGAAPVASYEAHAREIADTARSFRRLTADERDGFEVVRLRALRPRPGERIAQLAARTRSAWTPERLAVANALAPGAALPADALLKVALTEPYVRLRAPSALQIPGP
jgi:predicted Zn-dependent protease